MRRKRPIEVECPAELATFDPTAWPPAARDLELRGPGQWSAFHAWQRWMHARADFADRAQVDLDAMPYEVPTPAWGLVLHALAPQTREAVPSDMRAASRHHGSETT